MFDVGFTELFLLALIGLLVLGPERLPGVARTVGGFVRKARSSWISLRNTIQSELDEADISAPIKQASEELKQIGKELTDIPGFKPKEAKSVFPEPEPDADTDQEPQVAKDSGSGKNESV
jgi:Tat protein translocase TatB subunit